MTKFIITRHPGAIQFLGAKGIEGEVHPQITSKDGRFFAGENEIRAGDQVYGVLPVNLIHQLLQKGVRVFIIQLP